MKERKKKCGEKGIEGGEKFGNKDVMKKSERKNEKIIDRKMKRRKKKGKRRKKKNTEYKKKTDK